MIGFAPNDIYMAGFSDGPNGTVTTVGRQPLPPLGPMTITGDSRGHTFAVANSRASSSAINNRALQARVVAEPALQRTDPNQPRSSSLRSASGVILSRARGTRAKRRIISPPLHSRRLQRETHAKFHRSNPSPAPVRLVPVDRRRPGWTKPRNRAATQPRSVCRPRAGCGTAHRRAGAEPAAGSRGAPAARDHRAHDLPDTETNFWKCEQMK